MSPQPALAFIGEVTHQFDEVGDVPLLGLTGDELDQLLEAELWLISRMGAHIARTITRAAAVGRPGEVDAPSMVAWLRGRFGVSAPAASRLVWDAAGLGGAPAAAAAARVGAVLAESAAVIGHAVTALPDGVGPQLRAAGEEVLIGFAVGCDGPVLDAVQLRFVGDHLHEVLDPDEADRLLAARLDSEDALVHRRRFLSLTDDPGGGVRLRGLFTVEAGATLRAVLGPLATPAHARTDPAGPEAGAGAGAGFVLDADPPTGTSTPAGSRPPAAPALRAGAGAGAGAADGAAAAGGRRPGPDGLVDHIDLSRPAGDPGCAGRASEAGHPGGDPRGPGGTGHPGGVPHGGGWGDSPGDSRSDVLPLWRDERTGGQRLADALVEAAARLLAQGELPSGGGERPQLVITIDHQHLRTGLGGGMSDDGSELSVAAVRRLACDAGLIPAVLATPGRVLDLGRSARTASPAQRRALGLRDGGCAFPGCDRPPGWCEAHHIRPWTTLGPTDLPNLVLLCAHHHRVVHHHGWTITPTPDGSRPTFTPPAWTDPQQRPRRNHAHHLHDHLRPPPPP